MVQDGMAECQNVAELPHLVKGTHHALTQDFIESVYRSLFTPNSGAASSAAVILNVVIEIPACIPMPF
jgi:hypothetical protein